MVRIIAFEITGGIDEPFPMPVPETTSSEAFERYAGGKCLVAWRDDLMAQGGHYMGKHIYRSTPFVIIRKLIHT
jgi:hypothetical protein